MATKQQVREQITKVIQEGILTQVLPYETIDGEIITAENYQAFVSDGEIQNSNGNILSDDGEIITAQNYQAIVSGGQIQEGTAAEGEQTIIYQQDFQTAENDFNRFVDDIVKCYRVSDDSVIYNNFDAPFQVGSSAAGITFSLASGTISTLEEAFLNINLTSYSGGPDCTTTDLSLINTLVAITQFQSLDNTSTQINPNQAQEILDTTIFELLTQQTSRQQRIDKFFQDYAELKPAQYLTEYLDTNLGSTEQDFNLAYDIYNNPIDGSIIRLINNEDNDNVDKSLEWLRQDLNNYFLDDSSVEEDLQIYQERSSGYLKFREMNQAIIIRNTENLPVINDSETFLTNNQKGFTITMWVKFKDKISSGTLFNYGNPLRETNPYGFMLETYVLNANDDNRDGGNSIADTDENPSYTNWKELANYLGLDYFNNNDEARFLRLVVNTDINVSGNTAGDEKLYDSHMVINNNGATGNLEKQDNFLSITSPGQSRRFIATTNVPIDFNEWYFITATFNPTNDETISNANKLEPLYWSGNLLDDLQTQTYDSGLGNKCKVEIISKTDLLRARGYKTQ